MRWRRSAYDVTNQVNVTRPKAVCGEVCNLLADLYPAEPTWRIEQAFADATDLFAGRYPGFLPCDTPYHDLQHTLDVALAMARLIYGHEQSAGQERLGPVHMQLGIIVALFHDAGYMRDESDGCTHGAAYTRNHVSRSAHFLNNYLPSLDLADMTPLAARLVHYTGYEIHIDDIPVHSSAEQTLGRLVGTADLLAQMSDRCYLEKCRDRLYYEFTIAGIAGPDVADAPFHSQQELLEKTPDFAAVAIRDRLNHTLGCVHRYAESFFLPNQNLYWHGIQKNIDHLTGAIERHEAPLLRRNPPWTLAMAPSELQPDFPPIS